MCMFVCASVSLIFRFKIRQSITFAINFIPTAFHAFFIFLKTFLVFKVLKQHFVNQYNNNEMFRSFKSKEHIHKKEVGPYHGFGY